MLAALLLGCMRTQAWTDVKIRGLNPRTSDPSLAISADGVPFMLYWDGANHFKLSVAKFEKDSWVSVGAQGFSSANAFPVSLTVNAAGIPYVAYGNIINDGHRLWVMRFEGEGWIPVGPPVILKKEGFIFTSLALDAAGVPYVAYTEFDRNKHKLLVMKFEGGLWIPVGPPIYPLNGGGHPSLVFSCKNYVHYLLVERP